MLNKQYEEEEREGGNGLLTERYTSRELINGRLWHAVRQHARELGREKRRDSIYYNTQGSEMCLETAEYPQISVRSRWTHWRWSLWSWSGGARRDESGGTQSWRDGNKGIVPTTPAWNEHGTECQFGPTGFVLGCDFGFLCFLRQCGLKCGRAQRSLCLYWNST